jgi:hypothetical protein
MIMWIPHLISCGIHMKSEILLDQAAPCAWDRAPARTSPRMAAMAPTVTTHHISGVGRRALLPSGGAISLDS